MGIMKLNNSWSPTLFFYGRTVKVKVSISFNVRLAYYLRSSGHLPQIMAFPLVIAEMYKGITKL